MRFRAFTSPWAEELEFLGSKSEFHTNVEVTPDRDIMRKAYNTRGKDAGDMSFGRDAYMTQKEAAIHALSKQTVLQLLEHDGSKKAMTRPI